MKKILFAVIALLILWVPCAYWLRGIEPDPSMGAMLYDLGRLCALAAFVLIFFQYLMSARVKWVETGIGLDRLLMIHRGSGRVVLCLVLGHPLLMFLGETMQGFSTPFHIFKILGLLTLLILAVAAGSALLSERLGLKYETWKNLHSKGYALYPLAFIHSFLIGATVQQGPVRTLWGALLILYVAILLHKAHRRWSLRRRPLRVAEVRKESPSVHTLCFEGEHGNYKPGQFMILQLKRDGIVSESHPFTISSSPTAKKLSVTVKDVGDFTSTVSRTEPSDIAFIDMPYGVFSFLNTPADRYVFIAGGIGITPFISMLRYIDDRRMDHKVLLLWANKTESDILFREELAAMEQRNSRLEIVHVLSRQDSWDGEKGHLDRNRLKRLLGDFKEPVFFICGPSGMMGAVDFALRDLGVPAKSIHMERFALR